MKTAVITGVAGFLGSHLSRRLLSVGFRIIGVDNFITSSSVNISDLRQSGNFSLLEHDISEPLEIEGHVDYVLHFASPASPIDYAKLPIQTLKVGALGTHNALGIAKAKNAVFMLASTSEVYGDPLVHPQNESYWGNVNPIGPRGVYDEAKRYAEAMAMAYHRVHGLDTKIARIFNTYGPGMRKNDGRVVPNFINQALKGEPLTVYGDGSQTRSFCFVSDLVEGIYRLMLSKENEPVNIGNPNEFTILQFAQKIKELTGSNSGIVFKELPIDDPRTRCPDISKAKRILQWEPKVSVDEGLKRTIEWFKNEP